MTTATESIVAAIASALTGAGLTVRQDTDDPYSFEDKPVVVISPGNEIADPVTGSMGFIYWNLEVVLKISADGASPRLAPEATRQAAHQALYADRTLGGKAIDIFAQTVTRNSDPDNPAAGMTEVSYQVKYRVAENTV